MGNIVNISAAVKNLVVGVQQSGAAAFVEVLEYPTHQFAGFPSATIVPADVQSKYSTVIQNQRVYSFEVCLYVPISNSGNMSAEFTVMRTLVDSVIDALDKTFDLNGICDFVIPVPMKWRTIESGSGEMLAAPIHLSAQKDIALI